MKAFTCHRGVAAPLLVDDVDTDQIIPSREMKRVSKLGLGDGLFAGWRYLYDGAERTGENPEFVLNKQQYRDASVLLGGKNFGCGSSREHAVWALADFGIRAILAPGFGRIFRSNCARNGLLAVELPQTDIDRILAATLAATDGAVAEIEIDRTGATTGHAAAEIEIDLSAQTIRLPDGSAIDFDVPDGDREMLLKGLDYIDYTLQYERDIDAHLARDRQIRPWAYL